MTLLVLYADRAFVLFEIPNEIALYSFMHNLYRIFAFMCTFVSDMYVRHTPPMSYRNRLRLYSTDKILYYITVSSLDKLSSIEYPTANQGKY
jgi:hypothetical protein